ncbi:hypothetical protein [Novosphingobium pituita]|jgi:cell shape-determining protein MreC|uniref:DUF904 domain-containing protein n=1 Tax=Novosphingobium pituita TaxID=3056842 RepID=A0ABQ6P794_9SPHN|nr:hypothetical protein [Novosphingobium sp. IK01]MDK4806132.1 hypothetical protein [Novosphingobium aromaticivorans]GMM60252.1 hypothetical protein NUTIK01_10290 [Novosphingobium sp. IK01]
MAIPNGTSDLFSAVERIELALARLEGAVAQRMNERETQAAKAQSTQVELSELKTRHHKLKERVDAQLQQLDLLLSSLPQ